MYEAIHEAMHKAVHEAMHKAMHEALQDDIGYYIVDKVTLSLLLYSSTPPK
jgi:hypothetical protein